MIKSKKSKLILREYDEVILKTGESVGLMDQVDETYFLPDYGVETPEQEKKTMAMAPVSIDNIKKWFIDRKIRSNSVFYQI